MKPEEFKQKISSNQNLSRARAQNDVETLLNKIATEYSFTSTTISARLDSYKTGLNLSLMKQIMTEMGYLNVELSYGDDQRERISWLKVRFQLP